VSSISSIPVPPSVFVGRDAEIAQLSAMLSQVPIGLVFGVPGVGKSALIHAVAAEWTGPVVYHRVTTDETLATLVDDIRRQVAGGPVKQAESEEERLAELSRGLDERKALMLLDDAHRLSETDQVALFGSLGRRLRKGRVLATSRELLRLEAGAPDRFEMRLSGISEAAAQLLWAHLDVLYGASAGLDRVWARSRGNPFVLRRAHAGDLDEDPIAQAIVGLLGNERRVALALALAELRLPRALLVSLVGASQVREALIGLVKRLVIDVDGTGTCAIHDLFRDAIIASFTLEEQRAMHDDLARLLLNAKDIDRVVGVRESGRHLRAVGRYAESGQLLIEHAATLIRHGAASELLRGLEAIPAAHRSPIVRIARARTLGRLLDLRRAYAELEALVLTGVEPRLELKFATAQMAWLTGELSASETAIREIMAEPLTDDLRTRVQTAFALVRTMRGHGDEARRFLEEAQRSAALPTHVGFLLFTHVFTLWLDERDDESEPIMLRALSLFADAPSFRGAVLAPVFLASHLARLGRLDEAAASLRAAESNTRDDLRMRLYVRAMRWSLLHERGDRAEALAELQLLTESFHRAGEVLGVIWAHVGMGRLLLMLGRRREGLHMLEQAEREARQRDVGCFVQAIRRAYDDDPLQQIRAAPLAPLSAAAERKPGVVARWRALSGLRAAASANLAEARYLFEANAAIARRSDYAFERACEILCGAIEASLKADAVTSKAAFDEARRYAEQSGIDADLIPDLREALGDVRLVTRGARRVTEGAPGDLTRYEVVLDARAHELRVGRKVVSLKRRLVLRKLLYALAALPSRALSKEDLSELVWESAYNPLVHDNSLFVSVKRLRTLLAGSGVDIESVEQGYLLRVPERFAYVSKLDPASS
jgi:tetratricopeptide (TPR) repeat protein